MKQDFRGVADGDRRLRAGNRRLVRHRLEKLQKIKVNSDCRSSRCDQGASPSATTASSSLHVHIILGLPDGLDPRQDHLLSRHRSGPTLGSDLGKNLQVGASTKEEADLGSALMDAAAARG